MDDFGTDHGWNQVVCPYRNGNKGLLGLFMGEVMKGTQGKADPKRANEVVRRILEQN